MWLYLNLPSFALMGFSLNIVGITWFLSLYLITAFRVHTRFSWSKSLILALVPVMVFHRVMDETLNFFAMLYGFPHFMVYDNMTGWISFFQTFFTVRLLLYLYMIVGLLFFLKYTGYRGLYHVSFVSLGVLFSILFFHSWQMVNQFYAYNIYEGEMRLFMFYHGYMIQFILYGLFYLSLFHTQKTRGEQLIDTVIQTYRKKE